MRPRRFQLGRATTATIVLVAAIATGCGRIGYAPLRLAEAGTDGGLLEGGLREGGVVEGGLLDGGPCPETGPGEADGCSPDGWRITTVDATNTFITSLALDASDTPHVVYFRLDRALAHARLAGSTWSVDTVDPARTDAVVSISLAVDSAANPHVGYLDSGNDVRRARPAAPTWALDLVDSDASVTSRTSIVTDGGDAAHIVYFHPRGVSYATETGSTWMWELIDGEGWGPVSLGLDGTDRAHASYGALSGGDRSVRYAYRNGSTWSVETIQATGDDLPLFTSIALDRSGDPHVVYVVVPPMMPASADLTGVHYARWTGSAWAIEVVDPAVARDCSLVLDASDHAHISYGTANELRYAHWTGAAWSIEALDGGPTPDPLRGPFFGFGSSIALDSAGHVHISYYADGDVRYAEQL